MFFMCFQENYKKMMTPMKKSFIINSMRRASYRWYGRWQAEKRSNLGRNQYYCENPDCGVILSKKETQMDHIKPVVAVTGYDGLEAVLDRLLCEPEDFQRLCKPCHAEKTLIENQQRPKPAKKLKKKGKKRAK